MIQVQYLRVGVFVVAMTVKDDGTIATATGLTRGHAFRRLIRAEVSR